MKHTFTESQAEKIKDVFNLIEVISNSAAEEQDPSMVAQAIGIIGAISVATTAALAVTKRVK